MTDTPKPADRLYLTLNDVRWELVPTGKFTLPEVKEIKRVSGLALAELEQGLTNVDGDAWVTWIYASVKRKWARVTVDEIEKAIGDTPLLDLIESIEKETPEVADNSPLPENQDGSPLSDETLPASTLETSGSPL